MTFNDRISLHDRATALYQAEMWLCGIETVPVGIEQNRMNAHNILIAFDDDLVKFVRHFPDLLVLAKTPYNFLVDVKSEANGRPNYAIEADSLHAALQLWRIGNPTFFGLVDLSNGSVGMINANHIPVRRIYNPRANRTADLHRKFPGTDISNRPRTFGSGTPYVLLPKTHPLICPVSAFGARGEPCREKVPA